MGIEEETAWTFEDHDRLIQLADGKMRLIYEVLADPTKMDVGGNFYDLWAEIGNLDAMLRVLKFSWLRMGQGIRWEDDL